MADGNPGTGEFTLAAATTTVAAWRGFAVQAHDIIHGRSIDYRALAKLRLVVMPMAVLGADSPNPCRSLIDYAGILAVDGDYGRHIHEINRLCREVLKRCEQTEVGIDLLKQLLTQKGEPL